MNRYILTGTPGAGKTTILRELQNLGYFAVEEAATDIIAEQQRNGIAEPWLTPDFTDEIALLQKQRQLANQHSPNLQFFDRSPIDTYALCLYQNHTPTPALLAELERIHINKIYEKKVFFFENLGFCTPTNIRKISFEESLIFEKMHEQAFAKYGYECIKIPPVSVKDRLMMILKEINHQ